MFKLLFLVQITSLSILQLSYTILASNPESTAWLAENAKKPEVIVLPSGLQYKVMRSGEGKTHPTADSPCLCHYSGTLIDGTKFDSSYDRYEPKSLAPDDVIKGWAEAMQLMVEGDIWELYIPSELGYGEKGSPPKIGGGDALIFTLELMKIRGQEIPAKRCDPISSKLKGCDAREKAYVERMKTKFGADVKKIKSEMERISRAISGPGKDVNEELRSWGRRRVAILQKLANYHEVEESVENIEL